MPLLLRVAEGLPSVQFRVGGMPPKVVDPGTAAAIAGLEALPNVEFVGYLGRGAVHDFLSHAVAVLCTSDFEGFSNVFLELFWAGAPVLTRRTVDPDLVVASRNLGLVADDAAGLIDVVRQITTMNDAGFSAMSERCRLYVAKNHAGAERVREARGRVHRGARPARMSRAMAARTISSPCLASVGIAGRSSRAEFESPALPVTFRGRLPSWRCENGLRPGSHDDDEDHEHDRRPEDDHLPG